MQHTPGFENSDFKNIKNVTKEETVATELCTTVLKHYITGHVCISPDSIEKNHSNLHCPEMRL